MLNVQQLQQKQLDRFNSTEILKDSKEKLNLINNNSNGLFILDDLNNIKDINMIDDNVTSIPPHELTHTKTSPKDKSIPTTPLDTTPVKEENDNGISATTTTTTSNNMTKLNYCQICGRLIQMETNTTTTTTTSENEILEDSKIDFFKNEICLRCQGPFEHKKTKLEKLSIPILVSMLLNASLRHLDVNNMVNHVISANSNSLPSSCSLSDTASQIIYQSNPAQTQMLLFPDSKKKPEETLNNMMKYDEIDYQKVQINSLSKKKAIQLTASGRKPRTGPLGSYEDMIVQALYSINDSNGTKPKDIFDWMEYHCSGIPEAFRASASQALKKAASKGKINRIGNGLYKVNKGYEQNELNKKRKKYDTDHNNGNNSSSSEPEYYHKDKKKSTEKKRSGSGNSNGSGSGSSLSNFANNFVSSSFSFQPNSPSISNHGSSVLAHSSTPLSLSTTNTTSSYSSLTHDSPSLITTTTTNNMLASSALVNSPSSLDTSHLNSTLSMSMPSSLASSTHTLDMTKNDTTDLSHSLSSLDMTMTSLTSDLAVSEPSTSNLLTGNEVSSITMSNISEAISPLQNHDMNTTSEASEVSTDIKTTSSPMPSSSTQSMIENMKSFSESISFKNKKDKMNEYADALDQFNHDFMNEATTSVTDDAITTMNSSNIHTKNTHENENAKSLMGHSISSQPSSSLSAQQADKNNILLHYNQASFSLNGKKGLDIINNLSGNINEIQLNSISFANTNPNNKVILNSIIQQTSPVTQGNMKLNNESDQSQTMTMAAADLLLLSRNTQDEITMNNSNNNMNKGGLLNSSGQEKLLAPNTSTNSNTTTIPHIPLYQAQAHAISQLPASIFSSQFLNTQLQYLMQSAQSPNIVDYLNQNHANSLSQSLSHFSHPSNAPSVNTDNNINEPLTFPMLWPQARQ